MYSRRVWFRETGHGPQFVALDRHLGFISFAKILSLRNVRRFHFFGRQSFAIGFRFESEFRRETEGSKPWVVMDSLWIGSDVDLSTLRGRGRGPGLSGTHSCNLLPIRFRRRTRSGTWPWVLFEGTCLLVVLSFENFIYFFHVMFLSSYTLKKYMFFNGI